jgi:SNF2 family DNA or RNA helicase
MRLSMHVDQSVTQHTHTHTHTHTRSLKLSEDEQAFYTGLEDQSRVLFQKLLESGKVHSRFGFVLLMLLRLRQACGHVDLVPKEYAEMFDVMTGVLNSQNATLAPADLAKLNQMLETLNQFQDEDCCVCLDKAETPVVTPCCHVFCRACIEQVISNSLEPTCPLCRAEIRQSDLKESGDIEEIQSLEEAKKAEEEARAERARSGAADAAKEQGLSQFKPSTKMRAVIQELKKTPQGDKTVIFSQWTSMLDLMGKALRQKNIDYLQFDGRMSHGERLLALSDFKRPDMPSVLLISLKCGNVGLNLTAANRMFMIDPWYV